MTEARTTTGGARTASLGQNQYGKAETRVVRVTRDGDLHHIRDLNVSVSLSGDMDDVHYSGSNAHVLPTDSAKNTVYAFAKEHGIASPEEFGLLLARHFVSAQEPIHRARIRVEEYAWERIGGPGSRHSFARTGGGTRVAQVTHDGEGFEVVSGLKDLTVLNSTDSEFRGYLKDRYTTLPETADRVLATDVCARWRYAWTGTDAGAAGGSGVVSAPGAVSGTVSGSGSGTVSGSAARKEVPPDWDACYASARGHLLDAFAGTYSLSLQQTLYRMGARVVENLPEIDEVRLSLPNKHHFLVDLEPFGLENDNEVYFAADRPYGLIEATVLRDGAEARIPVDLTHV